MMYRFSFIILLLISLTSRAQFSATNTFETQFGNIPAQEPSDLLTAYDQLDMRYRLNNFRFKVRLEQFHSSVKNPNEYIRLSQYSANYRKQNLDIKLGSIYETLGRGLLLRAYEIPSSILEDRIYRTRQGFYKDILGGSTNYRFRNLNAKIVAGRMLNNQLPLTHSESRSDFVGGTELVYNFKNFSLGGIYMNHQLNGKQSHFAASHLKFSILNTIDFYSELAKRVSNNPKILDFDNTDQYGLYLNLNYAITNFGITLEWKDYHNFVIGSGIADPPTLVKEHNYILLNRSTHITEFFNEKGYQLEVYWKANDQTFLTLNHSRATNSFVPNSEFHEYFVEGIFSSEKLEFKTFADYSSEPFLLEDNRISFGSYTNILFNKNWSSNIEFEVQRIERNKEWFGNYYAGLIINKSTKLSTALLLEITQDPWLIEINETKKFYPAVRFSYRFTSKNTVHLFAGSRRGGPACTSGICYEVLDFEGIELRWTLKI